MEAASHWEWRRHTHDWRLAGEKEEEEEASLAISSEANGSLTTAGRPRRLRHYHSTANGGRLKGRCVC